MTDVKLADFLAAAICHYWLRVAWFISFINIETQSKKFASLWSFVWHWLYWQFASEIVLKTDKYVTWEVLMSSALSFLRVVEFWAEPRNFPFSANFDIAVELCGIL